MAWHTLGTKREIQESDTLNWYIKLLYESPVAKNLKVIASFVLTDIGSLILVVCFVSIGLTLFKRTLKSYRDILVKFLNKKLSQDNSVHTGDIYSRLARYGLIQMRRFLFFSFFFFNDRIIINALAAKM